GVGLMHGSMAMLTASQQEIPMVVMSGESTSFGDDPQMDVEPQWYGGVSVGGAHRYVEPIVKWSTQVVHAANLYNTITRAGEMCQRVPQGPVYLNVSLEAMLHEWKKPDDLRKLPAAPQTQPMPQDVEEIAKLLRAAKNPAIVVETAGRDPQAMQALIELADAFAAPVTMGRAAAYTSFPKNNAMWHGFMNFSILDDADLILLVSGRTPWNPPSKRVGKGPIVAISEYPIKHHLAYQVLSADRYLEGHVASALKLLTAAAKNGADQGAIAARRARWTKSHEDLLARLDQAEKSAVATGKLDAISLAASAKAVLPADAIICDETITHMPVMRAHLDFNAPQSFFRVTGGALGQGIAAAMGVKLGAPHRPVVLFVGDGSFLYNPVIQALGASKAYDIPITIIVCNNAKYEAMRKGHVIYYQGGVAETTNTHYGVNIAGPEYHELGSHFGFKGFKASTPDEFKTALANALAENKAGRTAIVNAQMVK
ncbi:MAG: thiamine pyrophosphate-binding protein, partial [Alphaproteobacteria bacterium]|nr:thiamine pyrophosphate-binding protein [Alphaproteobacteria bacterium]